MALLPVIWIIRWRGRGFLFGVLYIWAWLAIAGLTAWHSGQLKELAALLPVTLVLFGWLVPVLYLGPVYLIRTLVDAVISLHRLGKSPGTEVGATGIDARNRNGNAAG